VSTAVAAGLFLGVVLYAVFGGADYGAGFWDLTAGGVGAARRRTLIDRSLGPVWEANHTWLIYCLVILWTAFSPVFAAITSTLYVPLGLAALGIVLRGSGFAFGEIAARTDKQQMNGAVFALSSVITPFFLGAVVGGIASGRVPAAGDGDPVRSWLNPTSVLGGVLAVAVCAYLAAVFLTADARTEGDADLEDWFRRRAVFAAGICGVLALGGVFVLRADAHRLFTRLLGPGLPLLVISGISGVAALILLRRASGRLVRVLAVLAVVAVVAGWGAAQYPYLLGTHETISQAAAPFPTLVAVTVIFGAAGLLVVPSLALLYVLQQRGRLYEPDPASSSG
jgi:cytochrome bd ubiquinol oxidase subunit II